MKIIHTLIVCMCLLLPAAATENTDSTLPPPEPGHIRITLLNTTDVHGSVRRTPGYYYEHNEGSLLACATLIQQERAAAPHPPLLVDCGDIIQGTAESHLTGGQIMAKLYNAMGYDAFAVGNHEFDFPLPALADFLAAIEATPLAANMRIPPDAAPGFKRILPFTIREVAGLRIAIIGLTTPNIPNWYLPGHLKGFAFFDSVRTLENTLPLVNAEKPDLRILLVHQGLLPGTDDRANQIYGICSTFREFDVVLGGHLHWVLPGTSVSGPAYAQAGSGAQGILRIVFDFDPAIQRVAYTRIHYLPVTPDTPEDPALARLIAPDLEPVDAYFAQTLTHTPTRIAPGKGSSGLSGIQQLLAQAFSEAAGAEIVLHGILSDHALEPGPVTPADVWKLIPYENDIYLVHLTPKQIRAALEESAKYIGTARQFAAFGLQYSIFPDVPEGRRIHDLRDRNGRTLHGRKRYPVAVNSYHLASGGGRFPALNKAALHTEARATRIGPARSILEDYLRRQSALDIPAKPTGVTVHRKKTAPRLPYR